MTGPTTCQWSGGPAAIAGNLSEYHATCTVTPAGSAGALGAGSSSQTVGPLTTPQTVTFQFTATCTNDSFFDSHNPKQIVLLFEDQITDIDAPDHHVTDSDTTNNTVVPIPLAFWNRNPNFNPAFTMTIDSLDTTGQTSDPNSIPAAHNCVTNQNTSSPPAPLPGLPCEMYQEAHIPAGNPLSLPLVITPQHTATTKGFTIIPGQMVANGTVVAYFGFSIDINFGTGCTTTLGAPYPTVALKDGALPDGSTAGDPVAVLGPEGLDSSAPADIANPAVWPVALNSDPGVATMVGMSAPIQARYTATDPVLGTPVNIMVFNLGAAGYYTLTVTGDPTAAPTPPGTQCTPFDTQTDYLGSVSPGGQVLRTCDDPSNGTNYVFAASFTRADTFEAVTVADAMGCSATATPTPTPTPSPTLKPSPTPTPTPSPTLKPSPTVTPASLPRTGGPGDGGGLSTTTLLLMLAFASAVILTAGVSVLTARDKRK